MATTTNIVVARHWRPEMGDIADTLREVIRRERTAGIAVLGGGRLPRPSALAAPADVLLLSDDARAPERAGATGPTVFRVWWNDATEAVSHAERTGADAETNIVFFPETADRLIRQGLRVLSLPYAFAAPSTGTGPMLPVVGFSGEVDISGRCFDAVARADQEPEGLAARADELAQEAASGQRSLVSIDAALHGDITLNLIQSQTMLWAVRNRLRHRLLTAAVERFGSQLVVRGSDWKAIGFEAEPTNFSRRLRFGGYQRHRVSLDLGSKSTHAGLYPRSAEIVAAAGGIAQFASGASLPMELTALAARQSQSADGLMELVERLLCLPAADLIEENHALQAAYARIRMAAGHQMLTAMVERSMRDQARTRHPAAGPHITRTTTPC